MCHDAGAQLTARMLLYRDRATGPVALRKWDAYEDSGPAKEPQKNGAEERGWGGGMLIRRDERISDR